MAAGIYLEIASTPAGEEVQGRQHTDAPAEVQHGAREHWVSTLEADSGEICIGSPSQLSGCG